MAAPFDSNFLPEREMVIGQLERATVITKFYGKKVRAGDGKKSVNLIKYLATSWPICGITISTLSLVGQFESSRSCIDRK
jgi:hypothetical protein